MDDEVVLELLRRQRRRLAARLHDGPVQELTAAGLFLDAAAGDTGMVAGAVRSVSRAVHATRGLMRQLAEDPTPAEAAALIAALGVAAGAEGTPVVELPDDLSPAAASVLVQVADELLANVRRHAQGALLALRAEADAERVSLIVADAGPGGCPGRVSQGWTGLRVAAELLGLVGGGLEIDSGVEGTTVTAWVPADTDA
jgi:two-component system, NarL family, sensor kinase